MVIRTILFKGWSEDVGMASRLDTILRGAGEDVQVVQYCTVHIRPRGRCVIYGALSPTFELEHPQQVFVVHVVFLGWSQSLSVS